MIKISTVSLITPYERTFDYFDEVIEHLWRIGYLVSADVPSKRMLLRFREGTKAEFEDRWIGLQEGEREHTIRYCGIYKRLPRGHVWTDLHGYLMDAYHAGSSH